MTRRRLHSQTAAFAVPKGTAGDSLSAASASQNFAVPNSSAELAGLRVLLVDDEADSRELLSIVLSSRGAHVTAASSAAEAFALVQQSQRFGGIIISDIGMPEEDGLCQK